MQSGCEFVFKGFINLRIKVKVKVNIIVHHEGLWCSGVIAPLINIAIK